MPRRIDLEDDDEMPRRRRRRAKAVAVEPEDERGFVMRMLLHSPKDLIAGGLAAAAVSAIIANALFLQAGRHPSPMFGTVVAIPATAPSAQNVARPPAPIPGRAETAQSPAARRIAGVQRALTEYGYGQLKPTGTIGADTQSAISKFERDRKLPVTGQMSDRLVKELAAMIGRPID